jgi:hypothetical protein
VAALALLLIPAAASAATKPVDVRVLTSSGKTFADVRQYTGTVQVHASHKAKCFGPDSPSSDKSYKLHGATLLSALADAARYRKALRPLLLTDAFVNDGFGMGVCGIGGTVAPFGYPAPYWYSAINGEASSTGPDLIPVSAHDETLWYFTTGNESGFPSELLLKAPARVAPEMPFDVKVKRVSPADGSTAPAAGVSVTGALLPTDASGSTTEPGAAAGTLHLRATGTGDDVPSAVADVCVDSDLAKCPAAPSLNISGSGRPDRIEGGKGWDTIQARAGDDVVDISQGGHDMVVCGAGHDEVIGATSNDDIAASCEVSKG